jgi:CRISPR-associated protein Cas5d
MGHEPGRNPATPCELRMDREGGPMLEGWPFRLYVTGRYACFTDPAFRAERYSYRVMTPEAAKNLIEGIYWKPEFRYAIDSIEVLSEIRDETIMTNEVSDKVAPQNVSAVMNGRRDWLFLDARAHRVQRMTTMLRDVAYVITAHVVVPGDDKRELAKHHNMFMNRAAKGQRHADEAFLGMRGLFADVRLVTRPGDRFHGYPGTVAEDDLPRGYYADVPTVNLGWMVHHLDYRRDHEDAMRPVFFHAVMRCGVVDTRLPSGEMGRVEEVRA